jgi:hypothetical protein
MEVAKPELHTQLRWENHSKFNSPPKRRKEPFFHCDETSSYGLMSWRGHCYLLVIMDRNTPLLIMISNISLI